MIHNGRTLHFAGQDNTYAYFRYNDEEAVFVFVNNSRGRKQIPWDHYVEFTSTLKEGRNVLTGEAYEVGNQTVVGAREAVVVEFKRTK